MVWESVAFMRNAQLISSENKRDEVGKKLSFSHVLAMQTVVVNIGMAKCSWKGMQDEGEEPLTRGYFFLAMLWIPFKIYHCN